MTTNNSNTVKSWIVSKLYATIFMIMLTIMCGLIMYQVASKALVHINNDIKQLAR